MTAPLRDRADKDKTPTLGKSQTRDEGEGRDEGRRNSFRQGIQLREEDDTNFSKRRRRRKGGKIKENFFDASPWLLVTFSSPQ